MQRKEEQDEKNGKDRVRLTDDVIQAQLFGMVMGFIPTNILAGGNILETLLLRPDFLERCRAAACADDDDLLWRCLRETLRFRHINPGPWRVCRWGYAFSAGSEDEIRIKPGYTVLASTQSAMFDPRRIERPHVFDPWRRDEDYMVFGIGQHWCVGAYIAIAQITQTFKPLLRLSVLKPYRSRRPRMRRFGAFPLHLPVSIAP
jgi:cytochrome P450